MHLGLAALRMLGAGAACCRPCSKGVLLSLCNHIHSMIGKSDSLVVATPVAGCEHDWTAGGCRQHQSDRVKATTAR